jgi:hypothetical protein
MDIGVKIVEVSMIQYVSSRLHLRPVTFGRGEPPAVNPAFAIRME